MTFGEEIRLMEYNLEAIRMQQSCIHLAADLMPRFGPVVARDMRGLWQEHISERDTASRVLTGWSTTLEVTTQTDSVCRQIFIRLLGVDYLMAEYLEQRLDCTAFGQHVDPASQFRQMVVGDWSTDHWPEKWFRILGERQKNCLPE